MRFIRLFSLLVFLCAAALASDVGKDIVTGAFSSPDRAQLRNTKLETYLLQDADVGMLLKQKHFVFDVKYARGHYRSVLTHFDREEDIPVVLQRVKQVLPDAYVITGDISTPVSGKPAETAAAPEQVTTPDTTPTPESTPVATSGGIDEDIVVIDETDVQAADEDRSETVSDNATEAAAGTVEVTETTSVIPEGDGEIASVPEAPAAPPAPEPPYLLYGIIAAITVLAALMFIALRKPARPPLQTPEEGEKAGPETVDLRNIDLKRTRKGTFPVEEAPVPEAETQAPEAPAAVTEAPVAEEVPSVPEIPVAEEPLPVIEAPEGVEEELPTIEPAPSEAVPEEIGEVPVSRKKRDLPPHPKTAVKEDLAEFAGSRILVAEDNMINQKVITKLLEGSGIELVMADNGQIAVDTLSNDPNFDMILMDAHMPVKDGFEASGEIRADHRFDAIVIVALSGDVSSDDLRKMREAGMEEQLAKPLRVEALYNVMYQYLDFASAEDTASESEEEPLPEAEAQRTEMILNSATGLDICAGDKAMYAEILDEFVNTYADADTQIEGYIDAGEDVKLVQLSLDIKGVAANIGAERLSEAAETLREAVLVNQTESYARLSQEFKMELHKLLDAVEAFKSTI